VRSYPDGAAAQRTMLVVLPWLGHGIHALPSCRT